MKNIYILVLFSFILIISCSDDTSNPITSNDIIPPSAITDLTVAFTTGNTATLYFTATGDDGLLGRANTYEVRYSTSLIDSANYNIATSFIAPNEPNVGTIDDTVIVTGLLSGSTYYFAIKIADEVPNWSQISNIDSATTLLSGNWTIYNTTNSPILSNRVVDVQFDGAIKYIATLNGVSTLSNNTWNTIYESQTISIDTSIVIIGIDTILTIDTTFLSTPNFANSIAIESSTKTWIGTENSGVALIEGDSTVFYTPDDTTVSINSSREIRIDQNNLWIGTLNTGLHSFSLGGSAVWTQYDVPASTFIGKLNCIEVDANNAVWSGLQIFGATVLDNSVFTNYGSSDGFTNQAVWDIASSGNQILFGTDAGAYLFENNNWTNFTTVDGLLENVVIAVAIDTQGTFWFGTRIGLTSYDGAVWTTYTTANSFLPDNWINSLSVDMFGSLWIGTENGLAQFSN